MTGSARVVERFKEEEEARRRASLGKDCRRPRGALWCNA